MIMVSADHFICLKPPRERKKLLIFWGWNQTQPDNIEGSIPFQDRKSDNLKKLFSESYSDDPLDAYYKKECTDDYETMHWILPPAVPDSKE